jgi:hypothetical protein
MGWETWKACPQEWGHGSLKGYATVLRRRINELRMGFRRENGLQPDVQLDMLADEMQHQPGAHNREGYVRPAVANMEMAPRDIQGVVSDFLVQMDPNHTNASSREVQVIPEPFDQPAGLHLFHLDIEFQAGIRPKLDFFTHQFLEPAFVGFKPGTVFVRALQVAAVCLFRQIMPKLKAQPAWMIDHHLREDRL